MQSYLHRAKRCLMVFHSMSCLVCKHPNVRVKIKSNKHTSFTSGSISDLLSTVASVLFSFPYTPTDSQFSAVANILKQPKKILNFSRSLSISVLSWNALYELLAKFRMQWETSPLTTCAHLVSWLKAHLFLLSFMCPLYFEITLSHIQAKSCWYKSPRRRWCTFVKPGYFWPILANWSQIYALLGVLFAGLNNAVAY